MTFHQELNGYRHEVRFDRPDATTAGLILALDEYGFYELAEATMDDVLNEVMNHEHFVTWHEIYMLHKDSQKDLFKERKKCKLST